MTTDNPFFNWEDIEYGMAFTDVTGNLLWFVQHTGPLDACFKTETGFYLDTNKMTLLRAEEYDYNAEVFKRANG